MGKPEPDPLLTLILALEQQQPHAPISRAQVAEALRLISDRLAQLEADVRPLQRSGPLPTRQIEPDRIPQAEQAALEAAFFDLT